eukprot:gene6235-21498_t
MRVYTTPLRTHCSPATSHLPLHTLARTQHAAWDSLSGNDAITKDGGRAAIIAANHNPFLEKVDLSSSIGGAYEPTEAVRTALYTRIIKADPDAEFARMKAALETDGGGAGNGGLGPAQTAIFLQTAISGDIDRATFFLQQLVSIDKRKERAEQPTLQGRLRTGDFAALPAAWLDAGASSSSSSASPSSATLAAIKTAGHASAPPTALQAFAFDLHKVAGKAKLPVFGSNASLLTALAAANKPQLSNTLVFKAATEHFWQSSAKYFFWAAAATHLVELALVLFVALEHKYWTAVPSPAVTSALWFIAVAAGVQAVGVAAEMAGALAKGHFFQQVANVWFILRTVRVVLALAACCLVLGALPPAAAGPHPFAGNGSLANSSSATADSTTTATTTTSTFTTTTTTSTLAGALPPAIMTVEEAGATAAVFAWVSLTTCFGSLYYLLPHPKFGPLVLMIVRILADTWRFIFVLLIVTVGLAVSMLVNARGAHQGGGGGVGFGDDDADAMLFASPTGSLLHSVGYFVFGALDFEGINTLAGSPYASAAISMLLGGFVLLVMLMNLLIALLSDSYERAQDEAEAMFWLSKLQIVVAIQHSPARLGWYVLRTWVGWPVLGVVALAGWAAVYFCRLLCGWFFWREGNAAPFGLDGTFDSLADWYWETLMEPAHPFDYFDNRKGGPGSTPEKLAVLIPKTATVHSKPDQWQGMLSDIKAAVNGATNDIKEELKLLHAAIATPLQASSGSSGAGPQTEQGPPEEQGLQEQQQQQQLAVDTKAGNAALGVKIEAKLSEASADAKAMNVALEEKLAAGNAALEEKMAASNTMLEAKIASLESTMASTVSALAEILALVKQNNNAAQAASTAGGMVEQTMIVKRMVPAAQAGSLVVSTPAIDADDEYTGFQGIDTPVASRGGGGARANPSAAAAEISPQEFGFGTGDF